MKPRNRSGNCVLCGTWRLSLHRDHIIPKFKGGSDTEENIQFICANCHEDKTRAEKIGHAVSVETRDKIRVSILSRPESLERIRAGARRGGAAHKGRVHSPEWNANIAAGLARRATERMP